MRSIATRLGVKGECGNGVADAILAFLDQQRFPWLMVLDDANATTLSHWTTQTATRADSPLATSPPQGKTLITSRDADVATLLTGSTTSMIPVDVFNTHQATQLLLSKLPSSPATTTNIQILQDLAHELDNHPLALTQALSYMGNRLPPKQYLSMLQSSKMIRLLALDYEFSDPRRLEAISNSVLKNFWLSFEGARQVCPSVVSLLKLLSRQSHGAIKSEMLIQGSGKRVEQWEEAVQTLLDFSIIRPVEGCEGVFEMHEIVRLSLCEWLDALETPKRELCDEFTIKDLGGSGGCKVWEVDVRSPMMVGARY